MSERHALFMVSDFAPLTSVGRLRTQKMCKFLPAFGWRTSVLTFEPPPGTMTDPSLLAEVPEGTKVCRVRCPQPVEIPVRWASRIAHLLRRKPEAGNRGIDTGAPLCPPATHSGPSGTEWIERISRGVDLCKRRLTRALMVPDEGVTGIPKMVSAACEIIRRDRPDALVASVPGFSPWLAAVLAGRRTGVPVVVDYRDLWHGDVLRTWIKPLRSRIELAAERWALSQTSAIVTVSEGKTRYVRSLDRTAGGKPYATIYNGFDEEDVVDVSASRPARDRGRLLLLYTGRLYKQRRVDPLLESIGRLTAAGDIPGDALRVRLLGLIEPEQRQRIDALVKRYDLAEVVDIGGYVTRRESLAQQLGSDALVLIVDPGETSDGVLPGKITEYIGLGKFVLAVCPPGEARTFLERYGHAECASGEEPARLDAALRRMVERWRSDRDSFTMRVSSDVVPTRRDNAADLADVLGEVAPARLSERGEPRLGLTSNAARELEPA